MTVVILAILLLLFSVTSVLAAPILTPLTFILFAGPLGAVLTPGLIYAGLQIALVAGAAALQFALTPKAQRVDPGQFKQTLKAEESSELNGVGRVRVGGVLAFGNTKHPNIYRVLMHLRGPVSFVEEFFLNGRETVIDEDGNALTPPWVRGTVITGTGLGTATTISSYVTIEQKLGDGTETAWPALVTDFPDLWTSDHRLRGIFQTLLTVESPGIASPKYLNLFSSGSEVEFQCVARADAIYDPRDVAQSADDSDTWTWTDNGVLVAIHIMRRDSFLTSSKFDWDLIEEQADAADVVVNTYSGTEKRARCWGLWPSEIGRGDLLRQVLDSIGGELKLTSEGKYWIRLVDDTRTSEISFAEDDLVEFTMHGGPEAVERPNVCRVKYYSPERDYDLTEIDLTGIAWARIDDEITAYGEKVHDIELPFCPSASQAQRIARRLFAIARAETGLAKTRMDGWAAWGLSVGDFALPGFDETVTVELGAVRGNDQDGTVEIPFVVLPTLTAWDESSDEAQAPAEIPPIPNDSDLDTPDAPTAAIHVEYPSGGGNEVRLDFAALAGASKYLAVLQTYDGDGNPSKWSTMSVHTGLTYAFRSEDLEGDAVNFRVLGYDASDNASNFSDVFAVSSLAQDNTTPTAPTLSWSSPNVQVLSNDFNVVQAILEFSVDGSTGWTETDTLDDFQPGITRTIKNVTAAGTYYYRAACRTTDGTQGPYSGVTTFTI